MATDGLENYTVIVAICALLVLLIVLFEKAGLTQPCFPTKQHPAWASFVGLCSAEVLAMVVLVLGTRFTDDHEACVLFGALQHYSFQASLIWLALFNIDLYYQSCDALNFVPPEVGKARQQRNTFVLQACGWGIPSIVLLTQLLQQTDDGCLVGNNYGGYGFCFIKNETPTENFGAFWLPFFLVSMLFTLAAFVYYWLWYVKVSIAAVNPKVSVKLVARITRDLRGAMLTFASGSIALYAASFISANNPHSTEDLQITFCAGIVLHIFILLVWFVTIPAMYDVSPSWGVAAGAQYPISPDGSLASTMSLGSLQSVAGVRPMAVPMNMMTGATTQVEDSGALFRRRQRKMFAESWRLDQTALTTFAKRLRGSSPKGPINVEKLKSVWKNCFPSRSDEANAFAEQAFMALDPNNSKILDHAELCLFLAIFSSPTVEDRLQNVFLLSDLNEDEQLSDEELETMLSKVTDLINGQSTVHKIQNRNIVEMMMAELKGVKEGTSLTMAEFVAFKNHHNSSLYETVSIQL